MSDPFSVAGSAVGVVSLGLTVCQRFLAYYEPWKAYDEEIHNFTSRVDTLQTLLQVLETLVSEAHDRSLSFERYHSLILGNLNACRQACQRLEEMLQRCKANPTSTEGVKKHDWLQLKRVRYPFKRNTLVSQSQAVTGFQNDLSMALQILHMATIQHQQKQLQELTSRSSSIDLRTTQILSTVESQSDTLIPSIREMLQQESLIIQYGYRPILQPALLKQLVDRQVSMSRRFGSRTARSSRCTCASIPWGSKSAISFFALFLHEETCPLHQTGRRISSFGAKLTFCNRVLGLSLQVMMTVKQNAGYFSIAPSLHVRRVVADDSPAFELLQCVENKVKEIPWASRVNIAIYLEDARRTLFRMFDNGQASPKDMLRDGSTLLHKFAAILDETLDPQSLVVARRFIKALIDAEVPLQERDALNSTPLDRFIMKWLVRFGWHDLELPEHLFQIYSDLLSSGSLLTSPTQMLGNMKWRPVIHCFDLNLMRQLVTRNMDEGHILADVELALVTRSEEGLLEYIAYPHQLNLDMVILMCLGWPQGMSLILNSPLRLHVKSMLNPFVQACKARDAECALLLLEATEVITGAHLYFAALSDHPDILDVVVSRIARQRRELQNLALRLLSSHQIRQLGLPTEDLLDVHAFKVQEALKDQPAAMRLESTDAYSVYSFTWNSRDAANRLFEAGFKNLNQYDEFGHTPLLLWRPKIRHPKENDLVDLLHFAQWMVSHGAKLDQKTRAGYPTIYYLAEGIGTEMNLQCALEFYGLASYSSTLCGLRHLEQTCVDLLLTILLDDTRDSCSCTCSLGGCRPLTRMLRHFHSSSIVEEAGPWILDVFHCFQAVLIRGSLSDSIPTLAERVLRYVTFERIGIKHTCHYEDERLDEDEVEEIQDEERHNLALLEDLMEEFNRKCQELGIGIDEFLNEYWMDSMDQAMSADREIDSEAIQRIQELGVVLSSPARSGGHCVI